MEKIVPTSTPVPMPADWAKLHAALIEAWMVKNDSNVPKPPVPLILAGAASSTASAIRGRWVELIEWANTYGFSRILSAQMPRPPQIDVADSIAGVTKDGRGWWPEYGEQYHEPKKKPSPEAVLAAIEELGKRWSAIVGAELAKHTKPLRFTGHKSRRLLVAADPGESPPWGNWWSATKNPKAFTTFRKAINAAIDPMEVDEITFVTDRWRE